MEAAAILAGGEWGECLVPAGAVRPDLAAEVRRAIGVVPDWLPRIAPCPWLVHAITEMIRRPIAHAPLELCDLVSLVVSQDNSCRYCYGVQRAILRIYGYDDGYIDRLVRDFHVSDLSPAGRAALEYARRVSRANPRPSRADFEAVVNAGMSRIAVVEIVAVAALNNFSNRTATLLALPPEPLEQVVRGRLFRVMRPLMAWKMRPRLRPSEPLPEPNDGPCARVVAALAGSPTAGVIRRIIDEALASEILPRRTKVLMLAVIARALGCAHGEAEARQFLAEEGLTSSDVDEILRTLGSRRLDPLEAKLVPFARETVRYQPAVIQQRFRELSRDLSPEQVLETAGIAGLANAVCRLSVVLDAC